MIVDKPVLLLPSGTIADYDHPELTYVKMDDMLNNLSRQFRYAGSLDWTVLQHLALVTLMARRRWPHDAEVIAYAAAHDLHESYLPDVVKPLKVRLPTYVAMEEEWEAHVHREIGLTWVPPNLARGLVKLVDDRAVPVEVKVCGHPHHSHYAHHHGGAPEKEDIAIALNVRESGIDFCKKIVRSAVEDFTHIVR